MRLRKQLFIVSLITLIVPWAGCQYVREVDASLRKGQSQTLLATSRAVASRLGSDTLSVKRLRSFIAEDNAIPLYIHPLRTPPTLDGYDDDWRAYNYQLQSFRAAGNPQARMQVVAGALQSSLYLFFSFKDENWQSFRPSQSTPLESDHLKLHARSDTNEIRQFIVYASAPGSVHVSRQLSETDFAVEHQLKGAWVENNNGYQVELFLPLDWAEKNLALEYVGLSSGGQEFRVGNNPSQKSLPPVVRLAKDLSHELSIFSQNGVRLSLASINARFVARHGDIDQAQTQQTHGFVSWFYTLILGDDKRPDLDTPQRSGQFETPEPALALRGESASGWYRSETANVLRVAVPVYDPRDNNKIIGAVVADQNAESLANLTNNAFDQLLLYSVLVSTIAALTFLIYASWLSLRIRKLSSAAGSVISESGKIAENFPVFRSQDEIGDLSRNYAALLTRLREYTNYLRTLSSKLSHELRTPLAIVKSSLDNLEHVELNTQARTYADRAREGATRLTSILNSMSAASHVEQAISAADIERIPVDVILENLAEAYKDVYPNVKFSLRIQKEDEKLEIDGSGELLVQMLDKLVDNAADFCPQDGLVELGLYRNNNDLIITVRNEGPPLPKDMQGQLFDSMVSVRDKDAPIQQGHHLGLGLYIVRLIADFHRGEVQGYNVPDNSGVIFEIRLPAAVD